MILITVALVILCILYTMALILWCICTVLNHSEQVFDKFFDLSDEDRSSIERELISGLNNLREITAVIIMTTGLIILLLVHLVEYIK